MTQVDDGQWLTLTEASKMTGRSLHSLRMMIRRKKLTHIKKVRGKRGEEWVIHREAIPDAGKIKTSMTHLTQVNDEDGRCPTSKDSHVITLPIEYYERQQKERDQALQGLMMYRYKYEELERKVKLLPAPVEIVTSKISELEEALAAEVQYREQAISAIQEEQRARAALQTELDAEKRKPWWKKMFRME